LKLTSSNCSPSPRVAVVWSYFLKFPSSCFSRISLPRHQREGIDFTQRVDFLSYLIIPFGIIQGPFDSIECKMVARSFLPLHRLRQRTAPIQYNCLIQSEWVELLFYFYGYGIKLKLFPEPMMDFEFYSFN